MSKRIKKVIKGYTIFKKNFEFMNKCATDFFESVEDCYDGSENETEMQDIIIQKNREVIFCTHELVQMMRVINSQLDKISKDLVDINKAF